MKKILITGAHSYIGTSFENYMGQWPNDYKVDTIDMVDGGWRMSSFSEHDVVYHVAGIAHSDTEKVNDEQRSYYYKINTDLAIEVAQKAKANGVKQFIFMSSAIVYGDSAPISKSKIITKETPVSPANFYGNSKVQAENGIKLLNDESFKVVILRPPMIYGKGSKGNFQILSKIALKFSIFPYVKNQRSMLYIDNLVEFVRLIIENDESGIYWPQNEKWGNTSEIVEMIAAEHGKKVYLIKGFTWALKLISYFSRLVNKAFGNLAYDMEMSKYRQNYITTSFEQSIKKTEK